MNLNFESMVAIGVVAVATSLGIYHVNDSNKKVEIAKIQQEHYHDSLNALIKLKGCDK